jgi:hypoxanthine phosphoribosyltransferase
MARVKILDKEFETSIVADEIDKATAAVAARINNDLQGKKPIFLVVLNGAFMFASDLMKHVNIDCQISFVKLASYEGTKSTGSMKQLIGMNEDLHGRSVVIVEDIVDTGATITNIIQQVKGLGAEEVHVCTMLFKPGVCPKEKTPEYIGLNIPNEFIVGHGLDYDGYGRNLVDIYKIIE